LEEILISWKMPSNYKTIINVSKILIYFRELILPSTHKKKSDSLISDTTPEHSRKFTVTTKSETFRSPNHEETFVRPSPFGLRTDIAAYIGVYQNLDGFNMES
jgi:hypothetical protein